VVVELREFSTDENGDERLKPLVSIIVLIMVLIAVVSGIVVAQSDPFDLNRCQQNCGWLMGGGSSGYENYSACIENCNREFWKDFERQPEPKKSQ